jgi:glycosyltransferase involved in cell wall biosynthesis
MVSFKDIPILYTNSPNKLFDSLSAAKPIIVNSAGWTKELVEKEKCGFYVDPNKPVELVDKIKLLQQSPDLVAKMGVNSRILAEKVYDKEILCNKVVSVIEKYS